MRILNIVTWYTHKGEAKGPGSFHREYMKALQQTDEVAVYFPFDENINVNRLEETYENDILTFRRKNSRNQLTRIFDVYSDYKVIRQRFQPDVVHCHVGSDAGMVGIIIKMLFGTPCVVTEHAPIELIEINTSKKRFYKLKLVYSQANKVVCVSKHLEGGLRQYYPNVKFDTIYNGVEDPLELLSTSDLDINLGEEGSINCSIVASFYDKEIKGYQFLVPAIKVIREKGYNIRLHVCGGGEYLVYYKELSNNMGLSNSIVFYGNLDKADVYKLVSQMDFGISASLVESAGVAAEETMMLGRPMVVTKSGGTDSLVNEDTAIVVDAGSVDALVDGILSMIRIHCDFDKEAIRRYALDSFSMESVIKQYRNIYKDMI